MFASSTLTVVVGDFQLKTLVAIIILLNILGQCEMSIYPGKFKNKLSFTTHKFSIIFLFSFNVFLLFISLFFIAA